MTGFDYVVAAGVWIALAAVLYAYVAYPLVVFLLARMFGSQPQPPAGEATELPTVSLLISALNEERWIAQRIENALAQDYPRDRLQIVVASDGSTDRTGRIVSQLARRHAGRIELHDFSSRRGKATVLNELIPAAKGQIVVLSDANTMFEPGALKKLARWFARPRVLTVCGQLRLVDPATGQNVDSMYWRYETFLKEQESRLGALLGANGAVYAIRRACYVPIPADTIIDDFVIPLLMKLRLGGSIVYDREAVAVEETPPTIGDEFRRRARIGAGGFQSLVHLWPLVLPTSGWMSLAMLSHKVLRWFAPLPLVLALAGSIWLAWHPVFFVLLALQAAFYGAAAIGGLLPGGQGMVPRMVRLTTLFTSMNAALAVGFWRWVSGLQRGTWERTAR